MTPVAGLIADEFADSFARKIDEEILDGDATDATNHRFNGWANVSGTVGYSPGVDATPTLAEEVTIDNLMNEVAALQAADPYALDGAEWYFYPTVWSMIRNFQYNVSNGSGGVIPSGQPVVNIDQNWNYNLLGFKVNVLPYVPHAATAAKAWGLFGNAKYIIFGDMMSMALDSSKESRFSYDQTEFRAIQRCALVVGVPGSLGALKFGAAA
jgi:HK97 family phage major capsid protein